MISKEKSVIYFRDKTQMADPWTLNDAFWTAAFTMVYSISKTSNFWKRKTGQNSQWTFTCFCSCGIAEYTINRISRYARTSYRPFNVRPSATFFLLLTFSFSVFVLLDKKDVFLPQICSFFYFSVIISSVNQIYFSLTTCLLFPFHHYFLHKKKVYQRWR